MNILDIDTIMKKLTLREKVELCIDACAWNTKDIPQKGIPKLIMTDGPNGVRLQEIPISDQQPMDFKKSLSLSLDTKEAMSMTHQATCFPTGSSLACSFDTELSEKISAAIAEECKSLGVGVLYGPSLNTRRTPLDGRGFEYYSEDPCLAGEMAAAYIKGLQEHGVGGCLKHFACNNSNYMRTIYDNIIEERALREIYLASFERAVKKAKPATVMASYNLINGVQACENHRLLTEVLRHEWGFEGAVISDCGAIKDHVQAFKSGIDFELGQSKIASDILIKAVEDGIMTEAEIDMHCEKILRLVLKYSQQGKERPQIDYSKHHEIARDAAAQCAVLLKNEDHLLPLDKNAKLNIAILGDWAAHPVYQGTGCAKVRAKSVDIPLFEIRQLCGENIHIAYEPGYIDPLDCDEELMARAVSAAKNADVAIVFAGVMLPEETDDFNRKNMNMEPAHDRLIREVSTINKNTIVVLMNCEPVEMPWIGKVKSVLDMWYCGQGCGYAVAELLFGEKNPCGKLPVTMPVKLSDIPGYLHFPGENKKHYYEEGIFVGYRYYEKKELAPLFPFGHGLSYTMFGYSDIQLSKKNVILPASVCVSFSISNTGNRAGHEIAQLYIADNHSRLKRPVKELKHFMKVYLEPGETKSVSFELCKRDFAYYDPAFNEWVVDTGDFQVLVGASSQDIRLQETINVTNKKQYYNKFREDSHYLDVFEDAHAKKVFFDSLIEWGLLKQEDITPALEYTFIKSFWGMAQHLDITSPYPITKEMITEMVRKMNNR